MFEEKKHLKSDFFYMLVFVYMTNINKQSWQLLLGLFSDAAMSGIPGVICYMYCDNIVTRM